MTQTLQAVVFDWAGTLIDHGSCAPARTFIEVFRQEGVTISPQQAREPMGMNKRDHIKAILAMTPVADQWRQAHGQAATDADIDRMYDAFIPIQLDQIRQCSALIPGALDAVRLCRERGMRIGSSTGYNRQLADLCVAEAARQDLQVDLVITSDDVAEGRPHPLMILENMKQFGITQPQHVVNVDDTAAGVAAGRRADCWSIGLTQSGNELGLDQDEFAALPAEEIGRRTAVAEQRLIESGADAVIQSVAQLPDVLETIEARLAQGHCPGDAAAC